MKNLWMRTMLYDKATDNGGAGGGTGVFDSLKGGGANPPAGGDKNTPPPGTANPGGGTNPSNSGAAEGAAAKDWRLSLGTELQENPSLKKFTDVGGLAGAYVALEKLIGNEKIPVPSQHATDDDWNNVFKKLGLPEFEKYDLKFADGTNIDKEFVDAFKKSAHAAGVLPKQAQKLADWFSAQNKVAEGKVAELRTKELNDARTALQQAWGKDFDFEFKRTEAFMQKYGDKEFVDFLKSSGFNNNVHTIKFFNKLAKETMGEGKEIDGVDSSGQAAMSPSESLKAARAIVADPKHPYHIKDHPNHKAAVQEVQDLFAAANPKTT